MDPCATCVFQDYLGECGFSTSSRYLSRERLPRNCPQGYKRRLVYQVKMRNPDLDELVLRAVIKWPGLKSRQLVRKIMGWHRRKRIPDKCPRIIGCTLRRLKRKGLVYWTGKIQYRRWFPGPLEPDRVVFENSSPGVRRPTAPVGGGTGARESAPVR